MPTNDQVGLVPVILRDAPTAVSSVPGDAVHGPNLPFAYRPVSCGAARQSRLSLRLQDFNESELAVCRLCRPSLISKSRHSVSPIITVPY